MVKEVAKEVALQILAEGLGILGQELVSVSERMKKERLGKAVASFSGDASWQSQKVEPVKSYGTIHV